MDRSGSTELFEKVVRPHFERLYRLSWHLCQSKAESEDLFQEVLIKAFTKLDDLVEIEQPGAWLSRVMYNLFVDRHRRYARQRLSIVEESAMPGGDIASAGGGHDPVEENLREERFRCLERALGVLSEEHRIIVLLHDTEGYKLTEIQELMGIPVGTVKSRLHRARARLREILEADGTLS